MRPREALVMTTEAVAIAAFVMGACIGVVVIVILAESWSRRH